MSFFGPLHDLIFAAVPAYYISLYQLWYGLLIAAFLLSEYRVWRKYR